MAYKVILLSLCVVVINAGETPLNVPVSSNQQASFQITVSAVPTTSHQAPVIKYTSTPTFVQHQEPILQYAARYSPFPFPFAPQQFQFATAHIDPVPKLGETGQIPHLRLQFSEAPAQYGNLVQNSIPISLAPQTIQFRAVPLQYASPPVQIATKVVSQEQYGPPSVQYGPDPVQIATKVNSQEQYPLHTYQYNTAPVQISNKVVPQKQYSPPSVQYLPASPPAQYLSPRPQAQYLPAPPPPQYLPVPPPAQYLPAPVRIATKVAPEEQYAPTAIQYNPIPVQFQKVAPQEQYHHLPSTAIQYGPAPVQIAAKVVTQEQYGPPPHSSVQYASTPSPIQFASTSAPVQYASTPAPIQYASTPAPIQYASTPAPIQYASTPDPIQFASTPSPIQYASTPAPIQYSSTPSPIQYGSTHSPNFQYSSGPLFVLKKVQPKEAPFQIVVNDDQAQYAENSSPVEPEPQLQEVRHDVPAPKLLQLIKKEDYDHNPDYVYGYNIQDTQTGDDKSQSEQRQGNFVRGSYSVVDPDGHRRTVDYTADPVHGFSAVVRREPVHAKVLAPVSKIAVPVSKVSITGAYARTIVRD